MNEHSTIYPNWPIDWAVLWVLICTVNLTVCYHVTCAITQKGISGQTQKKWPNFSLNWQFWIFEPNLPNKYDVYIFGLLSCISFKYNRTNTVTGNPKTLKILPVYRKYTIAWPKIPKLWVNPKKCEWRKKAIQIRFTKVNVITALSVNYKVMQSLFVCTVGSL